MQPARLSEVTTSFPDDSHVACPAADLLGNTVKQSSSTDSVASWFWRRNSVPSFNLKAPKRQCARAARALGVAQNRGNHDIGFGSLFSLCVLLGLSKTYLCVHRAVSIIMPSQLSHWVRHGTMSLKIFLQLREPGLNHDKPYGVLLRSSPTSQCQRKERLMRF